MRWTLALVLISCLVAVGCRGAARDADHYQTLNTDPTRNTDLARRYHARALELIELGNIEDAAAELRRALAADIMFGPAHNNLGKLYYEQGKLYLAAWEFEYAARLMPHQPEPRNNLGLVFESIGKLDAAVEHYTKAMALEPDNAQFIGNAARARWRTGERSTELRELLTQLIMKDTRADWLDWAKRQRAVMAGPQRGP